MEVTYYLVPIFVGLAIIFCFKHNAYEAFVEGAKDGIEVALKLFPYLLAMIFATKLLNESMILLYLFKETNLPYLFFVEGMFRPLSNNASLAILMEIYAVYGVDSKMSLAASVLQGASETSFYVISIYFGAIGSKKYKYSLVLAMLADCLIFVLCLFLYFFIL